MITSIDANEDVSLVMRKVKDDVWKFTNGLQEPWQYGSLGTEKLIIAD